MEGLHLPSAVWYCVLAEAVGEAPDGEQLLVGPGFAAQQRNAALFPFFLLRPLAGTK